MKLDVMYTIQFQMKGFDTWINGFQRVELHLEIATWLQKFPYNARARLIRGG